MRRTLFSYAERLPLMNFLGAGYKHVQKEGRGVIQQKSLLDFALLSQKWMQSICYSAANNSLLIIFYLEIES